MVDSGGWCPKFPNIPFDIIDMEDSNKMEGKFTEEEVLAAISGLNGEKASGRMVSQLCFGPLVGSL